MKVLWIIPDFDSSNTIVEGLARRNVLSVICSSVQEAQFVFEMQQGHFDCVVVDVAHAQLPAFEPKKFEGSAIIVTGPLEPKISFQPHARLPYPIEFEGFLALYQQIFEEELPEIIEQKKDFEINVSEKTTEIRLDPSAEEHSLGKTDPTEPPGSFLKNLLGFGKSEENKKEPAREISPEFEISNQNGSPNDVSTLQQYLSLREQDVSVLNRQVHSSKEQVKILEDKLQIEVDKNESLQIELSDLKSKLNRFESERSIFEEKLKRQMREREFESMKGHEEVLSMEAKILEASEEIQRVKERVKEDIRKVRVREKELENKLEIARRDSEALLQARESHIIELKRKLDIAEFNLDLISERLERERRLGNELKEKIDKVAKVMRVAGGVIDSTEERDAS